MSIRRSSRAKPRADLLALGCSAAIHGIAVAAILALQDRPPQPQAAIAVAVLWSTPAAISHEAGAASAEATTLSPAAAIEAAMEAPSEQPADNASTAPSVKPDVGLREPPPKKPRPARASVTPPPTRSEQESKQAAASASAARATANATMGPAASTATIATTPEAAMSPPWSVTARVPPSYPMSARRRGIEGDVFLRVDVGADGRPRTVSVQHGSGDAQLDAAAMRAVARWRFAVAAPMTIEIPVQFRLNANTAEATRP